MDSVLIPTSGLPDDKSVRGKAAVLSHLVVPLPIGFKEMRSSLRNLKLPVLQMILTPASSILFLSV